MSIPINQLATDATEGLCNSHPNLAPIFKVGDQLGKYQLTAFLGKGGMGEVFRGFDPLVERDVAIKVMPAGLSSDSQALKRFIAEARAIGKLIHPNTVALYEIGQDNHTYFLAMEFVPGGSVGALLDKSGALPANRAAQIIQDVCSGLMAAHHVQLIHRDIKPENLLLTEDGHVKITDFGLAKAINDASRQAMELTSPGQLLGTPFYMSPEQFAGIEVDSRSDIYSVGATFFHLLTGWRPFSDSSTIVQVMYAHCNKEIPDPRSIRPDIPEPYVAILKKSMAKKPEDRFQTAHEMAEALKYASQTADVKVKPTPTAWLVEPSKVQAMILQGHFKAAGVEELQVFTTIHEVLKRIQEPYPSVIISALNLEDGTGHDLAAKVNALAGSSSIQCCVISTGSTLQDFHSFVAGRTMILPKPVTKELIATLVSRIINR
jgi:serine/threonine protein kinase